MLRTKSILLFFSPLFLLFIQCSDHFNLGTDSLKKEDYINANRYYLKALMQYQKNMNCQKELDTYARLIDVNNAVDVEKSISYFKEAHNIITENNMLESSESYLFAQLNHATTMMLMGDLGESIKLNRQVLTQLNSLNYEQKTREQLSVRALVNIGVIHYTIGNYDSAKIYNESAKKCVSNSRDAILDENYELTIKRKKDVNIDSTFLFLIDMNEANIHCIQEEYPLAIEKYKYAQKKVKGTHSKSQINALLGLCYFKQNQINEAEEYIGKTNLDFAKGYFYLTKNEYEKAIKYFEQSFSQIPFNQSVVNIFCLNVCLGQVHEALTNNEKASEYYQRAISISDSIYASIQNFVDSSFFDARVWCIKWGEPYQRIEKLS